MIIIIMIIMVMILYFFASYSLYVALCFSVVNKSKAPSHLLSAPRSPAVADLAQLLAAPSLRRQTLVRGAGGRCFLRI